MRIFSRKGIAKDGRAKSIEEDDIRKLQRDLEDEVKIVKEEKYSKLRKLLVGQHAAEDVKNSKTREVICAHGKTITEKHLEDVKDEHLAKIKIKNADVQANIESVNSETNQYIRYLEVLAGVLVRFGRSQPDKEFHRLGGSFHAVVGQSACDHFLDGHTLRLTIHRDGDLLPELLLQYRGKILGAFGPAIRVSRLAGFEAGMAGWSAGTDSFSGLFALTIHWLLGRLVGHHRTSPTASVPSRAAAI